MDINYFVCTLGQAAVLDAKPSKGGYDNINGLIDILAEQFPRRPAVGFPSLHGKNEADSLTFSFLDVQRISINVADTVQPFLSSCPRSSPIGLLCQSSPAFLFTWLALIRLGHPVLLVAPQLAVSAVSHLCKASHVSLLLYDAAYEKIGTEMPEWLPTKMLPFTQNGESLDFHKPSSTSSQAFAENSNAQEDDVAYLFHTSGTSSGLPKPIPQTHRAAVGALPRLSTPNDSFPPATFTTTPLYHGGIADLFRSWTSGAMICIFPANQAPITAPNIGTCLEQISRLSKSQDLPPVKYFSSVPYILQMLVDSQEQLRNLQEMDLVGVGGAALPSSLGDSLVERGVNLVSRYGSAECGFLLSSHRDYDRDKEWQYLRTPSGTQFLDFEAQDDAEGTYELVVKPGWPHIAKTNREDGSFATSDLFVKNAKKDGAWKYHSRKDAQLTLVTGKKFDPAPLEASIVASSPLISEALVFGNGETYPGALIFRSQEAEYLDDREFLGVVWKLVTKMNEESQEHAKLTKNMLVPMPSEASQRIEKSSKGTVLRKQVEQKFQDTIRKAYSNGGEDEAFISDEKVQDTVLETARSVVRGGEHLTAATDLFSLGMDSLASMQIRASLRKLLPKNSGPLSLTIVEDCGNVENLRSFIVNSRHGGDETHKKRDDLTLMHQLVDRYSKLESITPPGNGSLETNGMFEGSQKHVVLLTGATGALGSHVLAQLRDSPQIAQVYCLVRGATHHAAHERVSKALSQRGLSPLSQASTSLSTDNPATMTDKIIVLPARLSAPDLGLSSNTYANIASTTTLILHLAWSVNFRLRLAHFETDSIASVAHLLRLARTRPKHPPAFIFCSSTASAIASSITPVPEAIVDDPIAAAPLGYARAKWVGEHICGAAARQAPPSLGGRIAVVRVGQLSGDLERGVWNTREAWPVMLRSGVEMGSLPALRNEPLTWLAVDVAARAVVEVGLGTKNVQEEKEGDGGLEVFHVLNEHMESTWMDLLGWLGKWAKFDVVEPSEWVKQLEKMLKDNPEHLAAGLLGLWKDAYGDDETEEGEKEKKDEKDVPRFGMKKSKEIAPILKTVKSIDEEYFGKMWAWIKTSM